jgi:hypothetical protein
MKKDKIEIGNFVKIIAEHDSCSAKLDKSYKVVATKCGFVYLGKPNGVALTNGLTKVDNVVLAELNNWQRRNQLRK